VVGRKSNNVGDGNGGSGGSSGGSGVYVYSRDGYVYTVPDFENENPPAEPPADAQVIELSLNMDPTPEQVALVESLKQKISAVTVAINNLGYNETIVMNDRSTITGQELRALWLTVDFLINPKGTLYDNGSTRGEARFENGQLTISYNIDLVEGYSLLTGGLEYMILHEVGHATQSARDLYNRLHADGYTDAERDQVERRANDIARAIAHDALIPYLLTPEHGYSAGDPPIFTADSGGSDTPDDPGGGIEPRMPE
jgi:hypothetical protein